MSVPLYMDHHVKITAGLRKRGVDVITCAEDGTDEADDEWLRNGRDFAGLIYAEQ